MYLFLFMMKINITKLWEKFLGWLRNGFVLSKTVFFIWGLLCSHELVRKAVVDVLVDFLVANGLLEWKAILLATMIFFIEAVFEVGVAHVSEAYTGCFSVVIFCTAAYVMGLMQFLICFNTNNKNAGMLISAGVLIALGLAGYWRTLPEYFDHQLSSEQAKKKLSENDNGSISSSNFWCPVASFIGSAAAFTLLSQTTTSLKTYQISSYLMGATYLLFFLGVFCYYPEERRSGTSGLTTICRVIKAAISKRRLPFPCSKQGYYYSIDTPIINEEGSNDVSQADSLFYQSGNENGVVHLNPRISSCFLFLDKAAIISSNKDVTCTVQQVMAVKFLYRLIPFCSMLFGYSLVKGCDNTFFLLQASNLDPRIGKFQVPISSLFIIKSGAAFVVRTVQSMKELVKPIWSIAVGMFCSVLCGIAALLVERRRMSLTAHDGSQEETKVPLSLMVLSPQFVLLGLMEAFAFDGLVNFVSDQVPDRSVKKFVDPLAELLLTTEMCFGLLFASVTGALNFEVAATNLLSWYFLFLSSLSLGFFCVYILYVYKKGTNFGVTAR